MADADIIYELMGQSLERVFTKTALERLFGAGPERVLAAYRSFLAPETSPSAYLEFPLLGLPGYDVFVGPYGKGLEPGTHLPENSPSACRAAWDFVSTTRKGLGEDLLFELDSEAPKDQHTGVYYRHMGDLDATDGFLRAVGEGWRSPQYLDVAERLPEGWRPVFVGIFFGRPGAPTRIEVYPSAPEAMRIAREPSYLSTCFDGIGFDAYDERMLEGIRETVSLGRPTSFQFDILDDGSLGDTFSVAEFIEVRGKDYRVLFGSRGTISRVCGAFERMGVSDDRWQQVVHLLFASKRVESVGDKRERRWVTSLSVPICVKAKWRGAAPQPTKFYLSLNNVVGDRWSARSWFGQSLSS